MVGTIGFAGSKARERSQMSQWWLLVALPHVLSAAVGGFLLGFVVSFLGAVWSVTIWPISVSTAASILAVLVLFEVMGIPAKYASRAKQVPLSWKHVFPVPMSAALYGLTLGAGITSTAYFWSLHALCVALFVIASPAAGALAGVAFALGRSFLVILSAYVGSEESVERMAGMLDFGARRIRFASAAVVGLAALGLLSGS